MALYIALAIATVSIALLGWLFLRTRGELGEVKARFGPVLDIDAERARLAKEVERLSRESLAAQQANARELETMQQDFAARQRKHETEVETRKQTWERDYKAALSELEALTKQVELFRDEADLQALGLYKPLFNYDSSDQYKQALERAHDRQANMLKEKRAAVCLTEWTVEGSKAKGKQMTDRNLRLMVRAFNGECDAAIARVKYNNVVQMQERIRKSFDALNKLGEPNRCELVRAYLDLRLEELSLEHEFAQKAWDEREEQRRIREELREQELAEREIERAQKEAEKDEARFERALEKARAELSKASETRQFALREQISELERQVAAAHEAAERAKSRAELTKSGHVYVISNEGSFGENIYKVGMTRRLDPLDRVRELGDASVPFLFDVHAIIYSEDAPALENKIHQALSQRRVNLVNLKKEFFRVSLTEIERLVHSQNAAIEFTKVAEAAEYRRTVALLAAVDSTVPKPADPAQTVVANAQRHFEEVRTRFSTT